MIVGGRIFLTFGSSLPLFGQIQLFLENFIAVKPDGVQRGLVGKIICRFEEKGFGFFAMKMTTASKDLQEKEQLQLIVKCLERLTLLILFLKQFVEIIVLTLGETYVMDLTLWKQQRKN